MTSLLRCQKRRILGKSCWHLLYLLVYGNISKNNKVEVKMIDRKTSAKRLSVCDATYLGRISIGMPATSSLFFGRPDDLLEQHREQIWSKDINTVGRGFR